MSTILSNDIETMIRSTFNFEIKKLPLWLPDAKTDMCGLVKDTDVKKPIINQSVTSKYVPHQTEDVLALVEAASHVFKGEIDCRAHWNAGHYVSIMPTKEERVSVFGTADNVFPRIMVRAGYGGESFRATMGFYRDACRNMAMLRCVKKASVAIQHTSGLRDKMDQLITDFRKLKGSWDLVAEKIHEMQGNEIKLSDLLEAVWPTPADDAGIKTRNTNTRRKSAVEERILEESRSTGRRPLPMMGNRLHPDAIVSAWEAFNGIQGYAQWDKNRRGEHTDFSRMLAALKDSDVTKAEGFCVNPASIYEALAA